MKSILPLSLLGAGLAAQGFPTPAAKTPRPPVATAVEAGIATKTAEPQSAGTDAPATPAAAGAKSPNAPAAIAAAAAGFGESLPLLDTPQTGEHWALGHNYKLRCDHAGFVFWAAPADTAQAAAHVAFVLKSARSGELPLATTAATPVRHAERITWSHGAMAQHVDVRKAGIEQSFTFHELPTRGELVVEIEATGDLPGADRGQGITFGETVDYTEAVAIDADGDRVTAPTEFVDGRIVIRVPAAFVAEASLPLVVDPVITSRTVVTGTNALAEPDVSWNEPTQTWALVYQRRFALNDTDMFVQRLDSQLAAVGPVVTIDSSTAVWQHPAIANLRLASQWMVVAQVSTDDPAPFWISGRIVQSTGATLAQFEIERSGSFGHAAGDKLWPDVGGDPSLIAPTFYTVVWERVFSPTDHDVHMKQVTDTGALRSASPTHVSNTGLFQSRPSISPSNGPPRPSGTADVQNWAVVWQQTFNATDEDVYGALVTWDGNFVQVGGADTFAVQSSTANDVLPQVSSPTDQNGVRHYLMVAQRTTTGAGNVIARAFDSDGVRLDSADLTIEGAALPTLWPERAPRVECDGLRFTVAYEALYQGAGADWDLHSHVVALTDVGLSVQGSSGIDTSTDPETEAAVASRYAGSGTRDLRLCVVNELETPASFHIAAHNYDAYGNGGFTSRTTGCGALTLSTIGAPALGATVDFALDNNHPLTGFLVGLPQSTTTPACPGCTLGVDGSSLLGQYWSFTVPSDLAYFGITLSVQGFTFAAGPCLGSVSLSHTADMTLQ